MPAAWTGDPAVWVQIEETLALLPIKRRRLLLNYWASGNIADATRRAGYAVKNVKSACEVGRETPVAGQGSPPMRQGRQ